MSAPIRQLAENIWLLTYPLRLLGIPIGRNVTVIRLASGALVIHSTAPFSSDDVQRIRALGEPKWLLDATRFHDSYAADGRAAFPEATYLAPEVFPQRDKLNIQPLGVPPAEWNGEIEMQRIEGMPNVQEHAFLHVPSRTLIVGDILFNFGRNASAITKFAARYLMRLENLSGMSLVFRSMIRDRVAFRRSVDEFMWWDFDRVVCGHGDVVETGGKERIRQVLVRFRLAAPPRD